MYKVISGQPKTIYSKDVLQATDINLSSTQRVSGEFATL